MNRDMRQPEQPSQRRMERPSGVTGSFPQADGGPPWEVGYSEDGVWCGRRNLSTVTFDSPADALAAMQDAVDGYEGNHAASAEVLKLVPPPTP